VFDRHVSRDLSAYRDGQLPPARSRRVEEHLARCGDCRRALDDISFGMRLATRLPLSEAPDSVWPALRDRLERPSARRSPARLLVPAAALSGAVLLALVWYVALRNPLHVTQNDRPPSRLETIAIEEHLRRLTGESEWQIRTSEIPRLRQWVRDSTPMTADEIPVERAPGDDRRLHIVGARLARVGGAAGAVAAVIGYEVDSEPVTLATARLNDLPDPPDAAVFSKDVRYRFDPAHGYKVVTWGVAHKAYAMVSRLPGYGQGGCMLCHTAPERRQVIESATVRRN
jgi:putative zinc finger protein